MALKKEWILK